jgi:phage regulator Rha-like protein
MNDVTTHQIVTLSNGEAVTTTLIIAEGAQLQHKNVLELVRTYLVDLEEFGIIAFKTRSNCHGKGTEIAELNEQQTTFLFTLMRNSEIVVRFKKTLVRAFYEIRRRKPALDLSDPASVRSALLTYTEKVIALEAKVEEQAPKVAALERIEAGEKSLTFTEAAKVLGVKRNDLARRLHAEGWIYRQNQSWVAYSAAIRAGRLEYKEAHYTNEKTGMEEAKPYCHLTPKGLTDFARLCLDNTEAFKTRASPSQEVA